MRQKDSHRLAHHSPAAPLHSGVSLEPAVPPPLPGEGEALLHGTDGDNSTAGLPGWDNPWVDLGGEG